MGGNVLRWCRDPRAPSRGPEASVPGPSLQVNSGGLGMVPGREERNLMLKLHRDCWKYLKAQKGKNYKI